MGISGGPYIVRDSSLVLELDAADRNSYVSGSTTWRDLTANNNNGTLTNGPTFSSANLGSIMFDGTNDYTNLGLIPQLNGIQIGITLDHWISVAQTTGNRLNTIYSAYKDYTVPGQLYSLVRLDGNSLSYYMSSNSANYQSVSYGLNPILNIWYNIVVVVEGTNSIPIVKFYVNGSMVSNQTAAAIRTSIDTNIDFRIGGSVFGQVNNGEFFYGNIGCSKLYNRVLSSQEILQNYNALKSRFNL